MEKGDLCRYTWTSSTIFTYEGFSIITITLLSLGIFQLDQLLCRQDMGLPCAMAMEIQHPLVKLVQRHKEVPPPFCRGRVGLEKLM